VRDKASVEAVEPLNAAAGRHPDAAEFLSSLRAHQ
jgi:hypothetical protein